MMKLKITKILIKGQRKKNNKLKEEGPNSKILYMTN